MRIVQFPVIAEERDDLLAFLADMQLDYTFVAEESERDYEYLMFVLVETGDLEALMDGLRDRDIQERGYVAVSPLETLASYRYERSEQGSGVAKEASTNTRIAHEEMLTKAEEMAQTGPDYFAFIALSAIVATAGLVTDSAAVIVGSMVIAPLLGPAIGASVGRMIHEPALFRNGIRAQAVGLALAVGSAFVFALAIQYTIGGSIQLHLLEEVTERMNPGALSLIIAIASGTAGALAFTTGASAALVGVMIAAALIPPAAAVGLGLAFGNPILAVSAGVLVLVNVLCINLAGMVVLWLRGYRPKRYREEQLARSAALKQIAVLLASVLILSSFLAITTVDVVQNADFEDDVEGIITDGEMTVLSYSISYETQLFSRTPTGLRIVVTDDSPVLAQSIHDAIAERTGYDITVTVISENATVVGGQLEVSNETSTETEVTTQSSSIRRTLGDRGFG